MRLSSTPWKIRIYRKKNSWIRRSIKKEFTNEITEKENETWDECRQEVQSLIKDKLGIAENIVIERADWIKKKEYSKNPEKPRKIVCCFLNYKDKKNILKYQ